MKNKAGIYSSEVFAKVGLYPLGMEAWRSVQKIEPDGHVGQLPYRVLRARLSDGRELEPAIVVDENDLLWSPGDTSARSSLVESVEPNSRTISRSVLASYFREIVGNSEYGSWGTVHLILAGISSFASPNANPESWDPEFHGEIHPESVHLTRSGAVVRGFPIGASEPTSVHAPLSALPLPVVRRALDCPCRTDEKLTLADLVALIQSPWCSALWIACSPEALDTARIALSELPIGEYPVLRLHRPSWPMSPHSALLEPVDPRHHYGEASRHSPIHVDPLVQLPYSDHETRMARILERETSARLGRDVTINLRDGLGKLAVPFSLREVLGSVGRLLVQRSRDVARRGNLP